MRAGIYLGPPIGRAQRLAWLLVLLGSLGTLLHLLSYARERAEVGAFRANVDVQESAPGRRSSDALGDDERAVLARLHAASVSGVAMTISPVELLHLLGSALPAQVALVSVSFEPLSSPPSLLVEAVARGEGDVTALQKRVDDSRRVRATRLLGERTSADGTLAVRLDVDLAVDLQP